MKRVFATILTLCLLCSMLIIPAAADDEPTITYNLTTSNTNNHTEAKKGDVITVTFSAVRTDVDEPYEMSVLQNEIIYDLDYFEFVDADSEYEVVHQTRTTGVKIVKILVLREILEPNQVLCTFRLRVIADSGNGEIKSDEAKAFLSDGQMTVTEQNLDITIIGNEPEAQTYAITVTNPTGGTISAPASAKAGDTVNLNIAILSNYSLLRWTVTGADGTSVSVAGVGLASGASFVMPDQAVTVAATLTYNGGGTGGGDSTGGGSTTEPTSPPAIIIEDNETPLSSFNGTRFDDVGVEHWAVAFVEYLAELGFVNGKTETLFYPGDTITRAEFVTILARMSGETLPPYTTAGTPFTDVIASEYYAAAVAWAYDNGIVKGTSETTFSPGLKITRQDIAVMIVRYVEYRSFTLGVKNDATVFSDATQVAEYASTAVTAMQQANIINGYEDGSFKPVGNATRAEAAKMLALVHNAMFPDLLIG